MAFDYSELAQTALDLVSEFGKPVTLIRQSTDPADPQKPWRANDPVEKETEVDACIIPIKESGIIPQTTLQRDATSVAYVAASGNGDVRGTHFLDESKDNRWRVLDIETFAPGPTPLLHVLFLVR
jgi:hypothetical protein